MLGPQDDPYHGARQSLVDQINRDRAAAGVKPVELDVFSSSVGDHHCQQMAAYHYLSHWDLQGLLPYHRYHLAGGRDHVQENLSLLTMFSHDPSPIAAEPKGILPLLLQTHARYMEEKPPLDGHRRNVLAPAHTHVGIGLAAVGQEFAMSEEFLNRYVRLAELPAALPSGSIRVEGEMLSKDYGPYYCVLFYEGPPQPRTVAQLEKTYSYTDTDGTEVVSVKPWEMSFDRSRGQFHFTLRTPNRGPGFYHMLLWVRNDIKTIPYQLTMGANRVDTAKAVPAAGWVFKS